MPITPPPAFRVIVILTLFHSQLETRMIKFVHLCLNRSNHVCRSIIYSKLHCIKSTFASNCKSLSYRYNISHDVWYKDISHLIGIVKLKFQ